MSKNKTTLQPKGIRLDVDNQNAEPGSCLSIVGVRPDAGTWRPIPAKEIIVQALGAERWVKTWVHPVFEVPEGKKYPEFVIGWAFEVEDGLAPLCLLKVVELSGGGHSLEIEQTIATFDPDDAVEPEIYFQDNFMIVQYGNKEYNDKSEQVFNINIKVTVDPSGYGEATGAGVYDNGQTVILVATPGDGYEFVNWTEDGVEVSSSSTFTFTATEDRTIVANFAVAEVVMPEGTVKYGYLYNYPAIMDERGITSSETWEVTKDTQYEAIRTLFTEELAGGKLKEAGTTNWTTPNTGADNGVNFNGRGTGRRMSDGTFELRGEWCPFITVTTEDGDPVVFELMHDSEQLNMSNVSVNDGCPVRLYRDATTEELSLADGSFAGYYTGNDGKQYLTVKIGTQVWLAENLAETEYRNGDLIPVVEDNEAWAALETGACCAYNNDWSNVMED